MRKCEDCKLCCQGYVSGNVRGSWFGNLKPCKYLDDECTIYEERPSQCRNYYCAWAQELFPEWMRPDKTGVLISVEKDRENKLYLRVMYSSSKIDEKILDELNNFVRDNNTYFVLNRIIRIET
jgi:Fe-S-cluster containining protein